MIKLGSKVPNLHGTTSDGSPLSLRQLGGKFGVVYFYPKDNTTGCTRQAQDFRDLHREFARRKAIVLGVSRDSQKTHAGFRGKHALPFDLIADVDEAWCKAFDVIHEKVLYGRRYLGVVRSTFLLDADDKLLREWRGVKVPGHAAAVLEAIDAANQ